MTDDLIDDVLDGRLFAIAELVPANLDLFELLFEELDQIGLVVALKNNGSEPAMDGLMGFGKLIGQTRQSLIELLGRLVHGIRGRVQMNAVRDIPCQEQVTHEFCGCHVLKIPERLRLIKSGSRPSPPLPDRLTATPSPSGCARTCSLACPTCLG